MTKQADVGPLVKAFEDHLTKNFGKSPVSGTEDSKNLNSTKMIKQFKLLTDDGSHEIIAHERAALKAYYRAKKELLEAIEEEDSEMGYGFVILYVRNVDEVTLKGGDWEVYQEFVVPEDSDNDDDNDDHNDDLENLDENNVDDDKNDDDDD